MRRKMLLVGAALCVVGYLVWTASTVQTVRTIAPAAPHPIVASATARPAPTATPRIPPAVLLNGERAMRGATVNASGFGFLPNEQLRLERENPGAKSTTLATGKADKNGNYSLNFRVDDSWPDNAQTVRVVGLTSGWQASTPIAIVSGSPGAQPSTYFGKPLTPVDFSGGGFHPGEKVTVYFDSLASPNLGQLTADQYGVVHVKGIRVPLANAGQHAFLLVGETSAAPVRIPFSVLAFAPWLSLSTYTPQPEAAVSVVGHDFAPGETVSLFLDQPIGKPLAQGTVGTNGTVTLSAFEVPWNLRGKLKVVAIGSATQTLAEAGLTVLPYTPTFELSSYAGTPGSTTVATGTGFAKNEMVTVSLGDGAGTSVASVTTNAKGTFTSGQIRIPSQIHAGKLAVRAVGAHSQEPMLLTYAVLPLSAWISAVPAAGPAGTVVTFEGGSFEPGEQVQLDVAGNPPGPSVIVTADAKGALHHLGRLKAPSASGGKVTFEATGLSSGATATATFTVTGGETAGAGGPSQH